MENTVQAPMPGILSGLLNAEESTPLNRLTFLGSHNSYDQDYSPVEQIDTFGCRAIEFDINHLKGGDKWSVNHNGGYNPDPNVQIEAYLNALNDWHNKPGNADHNPIIIYLDLKTVEHSEADLTLALEKNIRNCFPPNDTAFFKPADLIGDCQNLYEGAIINGWPTLAQLRGKFILVLTGDGESKKNYANYAPKHRLCFADMDMDDQQLFPFDVDKNRVFFNYRNFDTGMIRDQAYNNASFIRCYPAAKSLCSAQEGLFNGALKCGVNIISIDCFDKNWAQVNTDHTKNYQILKPHTKNNAPVANAFWLRSMTPPEQVMDLKNGSSANGTPVGGWSQNNIYNQLWYEKDGCLWNKRSDTVLDLDNGDTYLQGWAYKPNENNQRWELELHEAYGLSCNPVTGAPVSSSVLTGDADKFTFEPLSFDDLDQLPESVRQWERNLHFIKNYKNQYLGISLDVIGRSKLKFYPDKSAITQLCFLRWNSDFLAAVVAFAGNAPAKWYLRLEKNLLSMNNRGIGQHELLTVASAPDKPGYYTIRDSVNQIYRVKNAALGKFAVYNAGQFQAQKENEFQLGQYWMKIDAGVATGMIDVS